MKVDRCSEVQVQVQVQVSVRLVSTRSDPEMRGKRHFMGLMMGDR